jgi:hypothetical protein
MEAKRERLRLRLRGERLEVKGWRHEERLRLRLRFRLKGTGWRLEAGRKVEVQAEVQVEGGKV